MTLETRNPRSFDGMGRHMTTEVRTRALSIIRAGRASYVELAKLASVSRQAMRQLALRAGIDPVKAREHYLTKLWRMK